MPSALFRAALLDAAALVLPVSCAGCGVPDRALCGECRPALQPDIAAQPLRPGEPDSPWVISGLRYDGVVRSVMLAFKDGDRPSLARALAPSLAAAARELSVRGAGEAPLPVLCPIPPSDAGRRGYHPGERLLRAAGLRSTRLMRARAGHAQKALTRSQRAAAAADRFRITRPVAGRCVVLVDDVITSGATLRAAAAALEGAGATVRGAVVVAATPRRFGTWESRR